MKGQNNGSVSHRSTMAHKWKHREMQKLIRHGMWCMTSEWNKIHGEFSLWQKNVWFPSVPKGKQGMNLWGDLSYCEGGHGTMRLVSLPQEPV